MLGEITFEFGIDGDQVCVNVVGKDNPAEDTYGFGDTKKQALENFLEQVGDNLI